MQAMAQTGNLEKEHAGLKRKLDNNLAKRITELQNRKDDFDIDDCRLRLEAKLVDLENAKESVRSANAAQDNNER